MVDLLNIEGQVIQVLYWLILGSLCGWLYGATVRCQYSTSTGKAIGTGGALLVLIGFDSSADAVFEYIRFGLGVLPENADPDVWHRIHQVHGLTHFPAAVAVTMVLLGLGMVWWGVRSNFFTTPEMQSSRKKDLVRQNADYYARR
ncbi:hypothetical protein E2P84_31095 [Burkholderia cepacia]|uniref:Transmembrane protein n=1 Tax=Burkholderia cepacia TaxID=292 RepID=A0AAX2RDC1_BURCE|nr:hypothetical protein [Burkholderia cepacia]TES70136.1 hypothetical protein E2P84_31095 [Burkholderia cepacia]TES97436.1 hypothetical protein E3D36_32310 [Burkholderia cepacia]TEU35265.1 hypothetical protein E3D37_37650 [Burkholderia cepacia]TEU40393.1 hypothetical protein E3D38_34505 [Burkholderia cepacia]TEU83187.1 hypothetical protein E3D40_44590 [Burkholderia cepacia]